MLVIRVFDAAGYVIETHENAGRFQGVVRTTTSGFAFSTFSATKPINRRQNPVFLSKGLVD